MDNFIKHLNIYIIPPAISMFFGVSIALLSLVKGKFKKENILFALVVIWINLLSPVFVVHHILWGKIDLILDIERTVHFFYVYLPFVVFLYIHHVYIKLRKVVITFFFTSFTLSIFTFTEYYFYDIYSYNWGYIARGGPAFQFMGAYSMFTILLTVVIFTKLYRKETNNTIRIKIRYIIFSFVMIGVLTLLNIPAINGIDFYPMGNFMFIPLIFLAYGVLRHRIMDINSILHITFIWFITSSLIIIPNILIYILLNPYFSQMSRPGLFIILIAWFSLNHIYIKKYQPKIDKIFDKHKFNLHEAETAFIDNISMLQSLKGTIDEFLEVIKKTLLFSRAKLILRVSDSYTFIDEDDNSFEVDPDIEDWFVGDNQLVEKSMVDANPYYSIIREKLHNEFRRFDCDYIIPLVHNYELIALVYLPEKKNLQQLSNVEIKFINNIRAAVVISLSNAKMYQNLSDLKDNLEERVLNRTEELMAAMEEMESLNEILTDTNQDLEYAKMVADRDMKMAVNVQKTLFPKVAPQVRGWDIAFLFQPMSGISGDVYDFYQEDDSLKGLSLFDVSGHGIASGLITMIAKPIIHRYFTKMIDSKLHEALEMANKDIVKEIGDVDNYLTGVILKFDEDKNIVEYVNAGHPDILHRNKNRFVHKLNYKDRDFKGMFLGFRELESHYETLRFKMGKGEVLFLYSDCIIEAKNKNDEEYGIDALVKSFTEAPDGTADEIQDYINNRFMDFTEGRKLDDDLTVIVIKKTD